MKDKIHARKQRDLQRARQNIDKIMEQPLETAKVLTSNEIVPPLFPVPPVNTARKNPPTSIKTSVAATRCADEMESGTEHSPTGYTPVADKTILSPVLVVAKQMPLSKPTEDRKLKRLVLPERSAMHKSRAVAIDPDNAPVPVFTSDSSLESDEQSEGQKPRREHNVMQNKVQFISPGQSPSLCQSTSPFAARPVPITTTTRPSTAKTSPSSSSTLNVRRKSLPPLPAVSAAGTHSKALLSTTDTVQQLQRGSVTSSCTSTTNSTEKEARLEARVEALMRQNKLLEAALMAVLKTGGAVNGCPCGAATKNGDTVGRQKGEKDGKGSQGQRQIKGERSDREPEVERQKGGVEDAQRSPKRATAEAEVETEVDSHGVDRITAEEGGELSALEMFLKTRKRSV